MALSPFALAIIIQEQQSQETESIRHTMHLEDWDWKTNSFISEITNDSLISMNDTQHVARFT
jgi:hypothetical protein